MPREFARALIVEDCEALAHALGSALLEAIPGVQLASCGNVAAVPELLASVVPDLVLLDFDLPDGDALNVLDLLADVAPAPAVIGMSGVATPEQSFRMAERGVRTYLSKPLDLAALVAVLKEVAESPPDIRPFLKSVVGHTPIQELERDVRDIMVNEALARAQGSRSAAAKILQVSRQLLQHMLKRVRV